MRVSLQSVTPDAELNIVTIARVSSKRENKQEEGERLLKYLIEHKHFSPYEHASMTLEIETSKAIGIQLIRHRSFTFQEFSQRYSTVEGFEDIELRRQAENNRQSSTEVFNPMLPEFGTDADAAIQDCLGMINDTYHALLKAGVARECARMVLPLATSTKIYMTGTIRSWIHFIQIRDDEHAQKEIRDIAQKVKEIFKEQFPIVSEALEF